MRAFDLSPSESTMIWRSLREVELSLRHRDARTAAHYATVAIQAAKKAGPWQQARVTREPVAYIPFTDEAKQAHGEAGPRILEVTDQTKPELTPLAHALLEAESAIARLLSAPPAAEGIPEGGPK